MTYITDKEVSYWDDYYSKKIDLKDNLPSQFAVFAISEINELNISNVIECGVGNGRDSIFFSSFNKNVIALDRSEEAIALLSRKAKNNDHLIAYQHDLKDQFPKAILQITDSKAFYARFFLHSLDKTSLQMFFNNTSSAMNDSDILLVEYRNENDKNLPKVTETHFREYYSAKAISDIANANNLKCSYEVSGQGFAKYKHDDAFVTRQIFFK